MATLAIKIPKWDIKEETAFLARCIQTMTEISKITPSMPIEVIGNIYDNPNLLKKEKEND